MTIMTDPPRESFRLSMLLYDTRYRSITIQIVALIGFLTVVVGCSTTCLQTLNTLGKPLGFGFLTDTAGYDINQRLLDYDSQDTHLRAAASLAF